MTTDNSIARQAAAAVLHRAERAGHPQGSRHDVPALTYCRLLVLRRGDFERFMATNPEATATINRIAQSRIAMNRDDDRRTAEAASL